MTKTDIDTILSTFTACILLYVCGGTEDMTAAEIHAALFMLAMFVLCAVRIVKEFL